MTLPTIPEDVPVRLTAPTTDTSPESVQKATKVLEAALERFLSQMSGSLNPGYELYCEYDIGVPPFRLGELQRVGDQYKATLTWTGRIKTRKKKAPHFPRKPDPWTLRLGCLDCGKRWKLQPVVWSKEGVGIYSSRKDSCPRCGSVALDCKEPGHG